LRKTALLFLLIFLYFQVCLSDTWSLLYNPFDSEWIPQAGWIDLETYYFVEDITICQDDGYIISGSFERWIPDEPPHWFDHWGFLMKLDSDGNLLWAKKDSVSFMDENDNYASIETLEGDFISIGYGFNSGYIIKRDSEGNRIWDQPFYDIGVNSICKNEDGNIFLAGWLEGYLAIREINDEAEEIWTGLYDCGNHTRAQSITSTSDNGLVVTGDTSGNNFDAFIFKTDSEGDSLWFMSFDINNETNWGNCVIETNDGNILCSGTDGLLVKLTPTGNVIYDYNYFGWNLRSCLSTIDDNYILFTGVSFLKVNDYGDTLSLNELPISSGLASGDRCIRELENGNLVCIAAQESNIQVFKTNSEGQFSDITENIVNSDICEVSVSPNPFNPTTKISFVSSYDNELEVTIHNILGQYVRTIYDGKIDQGNNTFVWDGKDYNNNLVSSGAYLINFKLNNSNLSKKCMLLK